MKIIGIGTDIIEIDRIKKAGKNNPGFLDRILTEEEKTYCFAKGSRYQSVAGRFAAKEAIAKALGTGFAACSFLDIEILNNKQGKPEVKLINNALNVYQKIGGKEIELSITHCKNMALAFVIIQG